LGCREDAVIEGALGELPLVVSALDWPRSAINMSAS
jgi:hypothetical protein